MSTVANTPQASTETTPRRRITLWHVSLVLIVFALIVAGYLTYTKIANVSMICPTGETTVFNCSIVESSRYASIVGIPTATWGFATYSIILVLLLLERRVAFLREYGVMLIFGIVLFAFAYHCYLTYTAIFTIGALCMWCLMAHTAITLLLIVTSIRLWRSLKTA